MKFYNLIQEYNEKKIKKKEWYDSLQTYYYELLGGYKFREVKYLKIYPFILEIQDVDIDEEGVLLNRIKFIKDILDGIHDYSYELYMNLEERDIENLCSIWNHYKSKGKILERDLEMIESISCGVKSDITNISDIYMDRLLTLLAGLPLLDGDEFMYNSLYISRIKKSDIRHEVERLIYVLKGEKPAKIIIEYKKGHVNYICI